MACSTVQNSSAVTLEDCMCPICMSILIEPVTMPCTHELCMPCFRKTVEEANLCCPMCRLRIATWARLSTKQKTLVNEIRWKQIQNLFPDKVRRRLEGKDDEEDDINNEDGPIHHPIVNIAEPGEIRKEYEEQLKKLERQRQEERSKEEAESADLIRKLQNEEEEKARELERQAEEQRLKDEEIARKLAESAELSLIENGEDSVLELSPKLTRTHSVGSTSKPSTVKTLDSFFFNKSSTDTSILDDSPDIVQSPFTITPLKSTQSEPIQSFSPSNRLEDMPNAHREFVKNQFDVMSNYSCSIKRVNKLAPATVTSKTSVVPDSDTVVDNNDTSIEDGELSVIFPPIPSPSKTSPTPSEFSISNISPTKKVIGLFPPQDIEITSDKTEKADQLCSKHNKMRHKNVSNNSKDGCSEIENANSNHPKPVNDKTVSFVDSDYESDETPSKSASLNSEMTKSGRKSRNKRAILSSAHESDSESEDSQSPKTKKVLKKRKSKAESVLSPQRSIKEWFSPTSSGKPNCNTQDVSKSETSPKNVSKKSTKKNPPKSSPVSKPSRFRTSQGEKVEKRSQGVSKSLQYEDDSNSTPLASKDNILNTEKTVIEGRKSRKSRTVSDTESVPSPSKRRRKRSHKSSDDDSENSESVSRSRSHSQKPKSKLTSISEGETTPIKKLVVSLDSDDDFIDTTKVLKTRKTSPRKTNLISPKKAVSSSPKKNSKKTKSLEKATSIEKQVKEKRKSALEKKQTKIDSDSVFPNETEGELNDFELALRLQREFDKEAKLASRVDRSKGSESEYSLRHKPCSPTKTK